MSLTKKTGTVILFLIIVLSMMSGCELSPVTSEKSSEPKVFMTQSDFTSGLLQWMTIDEQLVKDQGFSIYDDSKVKTYNGMVYILECFGADNIIKYDPSANSAGGIRYQFHLGDNYNPQDIEFVNDSKAYIVNMNNPSITIFNPSTKAVVGSIDISAYTYMKDSNTTPYANAVELSGTNLYVMLQRRNGTKPGAPTLILKINTITETIVDTIPLKYKDGFAMKAADGMLYVTNPGSAYSIGDGGIEVVNLSDNTVKEVISETVFGGNPNNLEHKSGTVFYVTKYIGWKNVPVVEMDLSTGTTIGTVPGVKDAFGGICYDKRDGILYVGERDSLDCGIRIFKNNIQQGNVVKGAKGLPPTSLAIIND